MKPSVSKLSDLLDQSLQVKEEPVGAANKKENVSDEDILHNDVDKIEKVTKSPVNEAQKLLLSNPLVKKHLKPNMTITEIIKVYKKTQKRSESVIVGGRRYDLVEFSPDMLVRVDNGVNDKLREMFSEPSMIKFYAEGWNFKTKRFSVDSRGIASCVKLNAWSFRSMNDVMFAGVLVHLVDAGILLDSESAPIEATVEEASLISEARVKLAGKITKIILKVALQAYSQGLEKLSRNESLFRGCCLLISESRIVGILKAIFSLGTMYKVMDKLTIKEVECLTPKLKWLSTPELAKRALTFIPHRLAAQYFDPYALLVYRQFEEAGLAAQIASGPLSPGCRGNVSPLAEAPISPDLALSQLASISDPYHEPTIRMAKIILDAAGFDYGNWYQGKKAGKVMAFTDYVFKACVEKVVSEFYFNGSKFQDVGLPREEVAAFFVDESAKREDKVVAVLRGWV